MKSWRLIRFLPLISLLFGFSHLTLAQSIAIESDDVARVLSLPVPGTPSEGVVADLVYAVSMA